MRSHVVEYRRSTVDGMLAFLRPDPPEAIDVDGLTVPAGYPCSAIAEATGARCAKTSGAVVVLSGRTKGSRLDRPGIHEIPLCGGHYVVHRSGKDLFVIVDPAR